MMAAATAMTGVWVIGVVLAASGTSTPERPAAGPRRGDIVLPVSGIRLLALQGAGAAGTAVTGNQNVDTVFKNVQALKGITVDEFMGTMGLMSAALAFCCSDCHTNAGTDLVRWEDDTPIKRTARRMVTMVQTINKQNFGGRQVVTCWTCHRGRDKPVLTPPLDKVYGEIEVEEDDIVTPAPGVPTVDAILTKYYNAIGGAQRVNALTSFEATGAVIGFGGFGGDGEVEIFAKAPDQRATHIHFPDAPDRGDDTRTFDGKTGWIATPLAVIRQYELVGGELDGARIDAQLSFPGQIQKVLTNIRVGPPTIIEGKTYDVVQGNGMRGSYATLYFDRADGLLFRVVRMTPSAIGRVPTQVDYSDYRDVNGLKMPHRFVFSWLDGKHTVELKQIRTNVPIDPARFGKPDPFAASKK
jgi:hypothetical protein